MGQSFIFETIAQVLDQFGPWAVTTLFAWYIYKKDKVERESRKENFEFAQRRLEIDIKQEQAFNNLKEVIQTLIHKL